MNLWIFAIVAYVLLALQVGLAPGLAFSTPMGLVEPRFVLLLAVFVGLYAPPRTVYIASLMLGLLLDLTATWPASPAVDLTLIGPYSLGYLAGAYTILQVRTMLVRHHPLAVAAMMLVFGAAAHLIVVAIFTIRYWYDPLDGWSGTSQLLARLISLLYSAAIGSVLAIPLNAMLPLFRFQPMPGARRARRW